MNREKEKFFVAVWLKFVTIAIVIICLPNVSCSSTEALLHFINPSLVKQYPPNRPHPSEYLKGEYFRGKDSEVLKRQVEKVFQIEPSDATDVAKYSQPALNHPFNSSPVAKVPLMTVSTAKPSLPSQYSDVQSLPKEILLSGIGPNNTSNSMRDSRYIAPNSNESSNLPKSLLDDKYKLGVDEKVNSQSDMSFNREMTLQGSHSKNNFSHSDYNLLPVPSDTILSYQTPSVDVESNPIVHKRTSQETEKILNISSQLSGKPVLTFSNSVAFNTDSPEYSTEETNTYNNYHHIGILNLTDSIENILSTSTFPSINNERNFSKSGPFHESESSKLSSGTVAGIVIVVLVCVTLLSSSVIYLLYRKYNGKCTSVVESKFNTDNCGYLDDSLRSSIYLNNHIELPKESSEEMSSLDNDSFLNSLETMTIQNYWADSSKNTKV